RSESTWATSPNPARRAVSRARDSGLTSTSANCSRASRAPSRSAWRRPASVRGMSVRPVCWPETLHSVAPWRTRKMRGAVTPIGGSSGPAGPQAEIAADQGVGGGRGRQVKPPSGAVVAGLGSSTGLARRGQLAGDAGGQHLAQLDAPLVERVHIPDDAL